MARFSGNEKFSDEQAVTVTAPSTNVYDLLQTGALAGNLEPYPFQFFVKEAFTAAGAATLTISLESSDNADLTSATVHTVSEAIPVADLVAGATLPMLKLPRGVQCGRYLGVRYTVATGPMTAGKITSYMSVSTQDNHQFADGHNFSAS